NLEKSAKITKHRACDLIRTSPIIIVRINQIIENMSRIQLISPGTLTTIVQSIGGLEQFHHNCHACSLAIVRTKLLPQNARVARGFHSAIMSQHSWVVLGDPYDPKSIILDGTLWS